MNLPQFADAFTGIAALLVLAALVGALVLRLRQPLIVGFIIVGILVGPSVFGWVDTTNRIHFLAELGLAVLLFVVGLRLDLSLIKSMGRVAVATGVGQVVFTATIGYVIVRALGLQSVPAMYVAIALTFSSTIIIVKLLSDKRETDSLHGRIAIGFLIVQDILVVFAMIALTAVGGSSGDVGRQVLAIVGKGAALLAALGLLMYFVLPRIAHALARSSEMLVLFAVAWAALVASVSGAMGFSREVGAFLAGVSLASTPYRDMLGARLVTLRDFLVLFFFIDLGSRLDLGVLGQQVWGSIPLSLFVLVGNPLIVMAIMGFMGYRRRTSFLSGLAVAQVSEFSLILAALGLKLGHIDESAVGLITLVALITIGLSTYLIIYSGQIYERIARYLRVFERRVPFREEAEDTEHDAARQTDVILFGLGRYGSGLAQQLMSRGRRVLGVDFDPESVRRWNKRGWMAWFGDAEDPEFPSMLPLARAKWVISSVRDRHVSLALTHAMKAHGYAGSIALTAGFPGEVNVLRDAGADVVFVPYTDAASQAADIIDMADEMEAKRRMERIVASLKDHYIVCGYGRMGQRIVRDLSSHGMPHVVVEWNPEQLPKLKDGDVPFVEGKATEEAILLEAGVERAKGLVSVAATDEENVFIVLSARGLNRGLYIIARSILQENEGKLLRAGANRVMSPYVLGGKRMAAAILNPRVVDFLDLMGHTEKTELEVGDIRVSPGAPFAGKPLKESRIRETTGATVLAIKRPDQPLRPNPTPDAVIEPGDELIVMGSAEEIDKVEEMAAG